MRISHTIKILQLTSWTDTRLHNHLALTGEFPAGLFLKECLSLEILAYHCSLTHDIIGFFWNLYKGKICGGDFQAALKNHHHICFSNSISHKPFCSNCAILLGGSFNTPQNTGENCHCNYQVYEDSNHHNSRTNPLKELSNHPGQ